MQGSLVTTFPAAEKGGVGSIPAKPFSEDLLKKLVALSAIFGALAVAPVKALSESSLNNPFTTASFMCGALAAFVYGSRLPKSFTKIVHPLVTSSFFALVQAKLLALLKGQSLETMLKVFKSGSFAFQTVGAGDLLLFALGPTVISLSLAMYSRKTLMADNLAVVLTGALVSSVGGLFSSAIAVRLLKIASDIVSLSVISRSVTTPLAMAITGMLGGNVPIAISVVVLSGKYEENPIFCCTNLTALKVIPTHYELVSLHLSKFNRRNFWRNCRTIAIDKFGHCRSAGTRFRNGGWGSGCWRGSYGG